MEHVKTLILGGGPAGFTAAIYAARANLSPVLYEGIQPGGQLTTTTVVENFPGFPGGVDANTLMDNMREQARSFGADVRQGTATAVDLGVRPFRITIDAEKELEADALIIATGAQARYLGLPSEEKFKGAGVSACATCDGFFYRKRTVAVVGGGDTACEEALYLASLAKKVSRCSGTATPRKCWATTWVSPAPASSARTARSLTLPSTAFSWPLAIRPHRPCSPPGCNWTPTVTSSPGPNRPRPTCPACSPPAMCRIRATARP